MTAHKSACLAEGTAIWLPDGTTVPIEEVVANRHPVLSYDTAWDTRPVKYGPNQPARNRSVGNLVPTVPVAWLDNGIRPVAAIRFVSGRVIEAAYGHRWITRRKNGRRAWEWKTTADIKRGDHLPIPLTAAHFGDKGDAWDGYFVGAMLGDGGMTGTTPEFHGDPDDGVVAFIREYTTKLGCLVTEIPRPGCVRLRLTDPRHRRNAVIDVLREYDVWGKRVEVKALPNEPFSREFWIGALSGLIDTDGCVRERRNAKETLHGSVEFGVVSRKLAEQVADAMLRLGVPSVVRERAVRIRDNGEIAGRSPLHVVEVNRGPALVRLAELLDLRVGSKAAKLQSLAGRLAHIQPAASEMHGYDPAVAMDRVLTIDSAGDKPTYCVNVEPSNLFVANGVITGNCTRNLRHAVMPTGRANRHEFGGFSDATFRMIPLLESGASATWPWL